VTGYEGDLRRTKGDEMRESRLLELWWRGASDRKLAKLKAEYQLDTVLLGGATELMQLARLRDWVHSRFRHHSSNFPAEFDSLYILEQAKRGEQYRCVEYSFLLADVYRAMGWPARLVRLEGARGAHVVTEVYSPGFGKWILMDGQHAAHVLRKGVPVSVYEFQQAVLSSQDSELSPQHVDETLDYVEWNTGYLRYLMYPQDMSYGKQLVTLLVLVLAGDAGPETKPAYLLEYGTEYIITHDPKVVYPADVLSVGSASG